MERLAAALKSAPSKEDSTCLQDEAVARDSQSFAAPPGEQPFLQRQMPQLDVLRGLAVLMVLFYHGFYDTQPSQPELVANIFSRITDFGWLGVNLFFCLSGFLITGNLLDSKNKPRYYQKFYIRRALRILPALALLFVILLLCHQISVGAAVLSAAFLANYQQLLPKALFYGPLWTLSVEEQFYIVWPIVVLHLRRRRLIQISIVICLIEPVLRAIAVRSGLSSDLAHRATFLIADNLVLGALVALFARTRYGTKRNAARLALVVIAASFLILLATIRLDLLTRANPYGAASEIVPFELMFTGIMLGSLAMPSTAFTRKRFFVIQWLGYISYGLYLVHPLMYTEWDKFTGFKKGGYYGHFGAEVLRFLVCASLSILVAWISRRFYEERFLSLKARLAP